MRALVSAVAVIVLIAAPVRAGGWHSGSSLVCTDCHSQHGGPTPAPKLLTRATTIELCLSCHDGMNPSAPDVIAPVGYVSESAAGAFPNSGGLATCYAHQSAILVSPGQWVGRGDLIGRIHRRGRCVGPLVGRHGAVEGRDGGAERCDQRRRDGAAD